MKYRSLWPTFSLRSNNGHIHSFIPNFHEPGRYKAKLLDHEIYVKEIYFYYEVKGWAILTHYPQLSFSCIKPSSRYIAKSLDYEIEVTVKHGCMEERTNGRKDENFIPLDILRMPEL